MHRILGTEDHLAVQEAGSLMANELRTVKLPATLCQAAEQRFAAHFGSLEQFLEFVLKELVHDEAGQMDQNEQRIIEKRLKDLGYI